MLKELEFYFDYFVSKRTEEVGRVILMNNLFYRKLAEGKRNSFAVLLKNIPESCQDWLYDFEDKENYQSAFANELMYRQGLVDGLNMLNIAINNHVEKNFVGIFEEDTGIL